MTDNGCTTEDQATRAGSRRNFAGEPHGYLLRAVWQACSGTKANSQILLAFVSRLGIARPCGYTFMQGLDG